MNFTPVKTSKFIQRVFPKLTWEYPSEEKALYLTFDDGPTPKITDWTLDILNEYNAKATFFCIGKNAEAHPKLFKRIIYEGHSIGNHTYNHDKGWKIKTKDYIKSIKKTTTVFKSFELNSKLFRPPYGQIKPNQANQLLKKDYNIIMWSILSIDWNMKTTREACLNNVINNATSGDIIVFHDSIKASENMMYALPRVLEHYIKLGYTFKRIPE